MCVYCTFFYEFIINILTRFFNYFCYFYPALHLFWSILQNTFLVFYVHGYFSIASTESVFDIESFMGFFHFY